MARAKNILPQIKSGGVTVSGGEPLLQAEFIAELFRLLKAEGIHTALDTSGVTFDKDNPQSVEKHLSVLRYTDLVLLDIKHIDEDEHKALTGFSNENTLAFARYLSKNVKKMWIRHVLVPDITDNDEYLHKLKRFIDGLSTVERVELLPYHTMGEKKYESLGLEYKLHGVPAMDQKTLLVKKQAILDGVKAARKEAEAMKN